MVKERLTDFMIGLINTALNLFKFADKADDVARVAGVASNVASGASKSSGLMSLADDVFIKISDFVSKPGTAGWLGKASLAAGAGVVVTEGISIANGKSTGHLSDVVTGIVDMDSADYHEDGGTQTGTTYKTAGKVLQNIGIGVFNLAIAAPGVLSKLAPGHVGTLMNVTKGLMAWQAATGVQEAMEGNGSWFDIASSGLSALTLGGTLKGLRGMNLNAAG